MSESNIIMHFLLFGYGSHTVRIQADPQRADPQNANPQCVGYSCFHCCFFGRADCRAGADQSWWRYELRRSVGSAERGIGAK